MQLILILLSTVAILTLLSGIITFFGAKKKDKVKSAWFLVATLFATVWMISISIFLAANPDMMNSIDWHIKWILISAVMIDVAFLGYIAWDSRLGKILTYIFFIMGGLISIAILFWPHLMYNSVTLSSGNNSVELNIGPFYTIYTAFFCLIIPAIVAMLFKQSASTNSKRKRGGDLVIMSFFAISSILIAVSDLVLPLFGNWKLVWVGPLALSMTIIAFYYTILRYRSLNLSSIWLKVFSYTVIISFIAIIYIIIFALIFMALFRGSTPSTEVIVLNFIMIVILILLMPAMNQVMLNIRQIISEQHPKKGKNNG